MNKNAKWTVEISPNSRSVVVVDGPDLVANVKGDNSLAVERANLIAAAPDLLCVVKLAKMAAEIDPFDTVSRLKLVSMLANLRIIAASAIYRAEGRG